MELRTQRLVLRDFRPEDATTAFAYRDDPDYLRYYKPGKSSRPDNRVLVERFVEWAGQEPRQNYQLAITLDGALIGCAGIRQATMEPGSGEVGIELDPQYWGQGYAREAGAGLVDFAFADLGLQCLQARCISANAAIRRLLERLGMTLARDLEPEPWMRQRGWTTCLYRCDRQVGKQDNRIEP
ncbi:MAG: GNAT family N-acetyltransferase [Candidatus Latescibacteria bacterium]|nr:GNAT family N-acetyltransferase [Candidatus Latescibacterota bacterium]